MPKRADSLLFELGLAKSRTHASTLIKQGLVSADGVLVKKPSELIGEDCKIEIADGGCPYVSRGGLKLEKALDFFGVDVKDAVCVDIGASTGGFTHCLLTRGAKKVYAVDVGFGQLDKLIEGDSRVVSIEKVNARTLDKSLFCDTIDIAVMDVSFISQTLIYPAISGIIKENGLLVTLIKPQFELGQQALNRQGIVRELNKHYPALIQKITEIARQNGLSLACVTESPITGGDGNKEYLALFEKKK